MVQQREDSKRAKVTEHTLQNKYAYYIHTLWEHGAEQTGNGDADSIVKMDLSTKSDTNDQKQQNCP